MPTATQAEHFARWKQDVNYLLQLSEEELFGLDYPSLQAVQLHHLRTRFEGMRPKLRALDRLASETGVQSIETLDDVVPLCFPHTMYKSYSIKNVEEGRFDRMTKWLSTLSTVDFSGLDVSACESMEAWLQLIETKTKLRPLTSSGTSGKISIFPRTEFEEEVAYLEMLLRAFDPYRDEPRVDFRSGKIPLLFPWPNDKGRHNIPVLFRLLRKKLFSGREEMIITLGKGLVTADEMLLASKLRRAESRGEQLTLSPREKEIARHLAERNKNTGDQMRRFFEEAVVKQRGKTVVLWAPWFQIYQIAKFSKDQQIKIEWAPDSLIVSGGGTKGNTFPPGWRDLIEEMIPLPGRYIEAYSFTESTANAPLCSRGHLHPRQWGIPFVLDPDTSAPLPRSGIQKGRCAFFDLVAQSYWGGTITGDEVTINWDGGCACGRQGPYFLNDIRRYIETRDGDDKITCSKTPDAYEKLAEFSLSLAE